MRSARGIAASQLPAFLTTRRRRARVAKDGRGEEYFSLAREYSPRTRGRAREREESRILACSALFFHVPMCVAGDDLPFGARALGLGIGFCATWAQRHFVTCMSCGGSVG